MIHKKMVRSKHFKWLLFFYSVPSKPVNARMKIWRRLARAGAVQLKGALYILPYSEENLELCQWLVSEVTSVKGDGAFVSVDKVETITDEDIISLFNQQRERDYGVVEKSLEALGQKISSIRKGTGMHNNKRLLGQFGRHLKEFEEIQKIDFFASKTGTNLKKKFDVLQKEIKGLSKTGIAQPQKVVNRDIENYQGRTWVTRKKPFVDRMASAWLIKKFIDKKAVFKFIDEKDMEGLDRKTTTFDIRDGEFTHTGDMCTFEALIKTFNLKDKTIKKIAEIIHEIDIKDEKYKNPDASGIEEILTGIRKTAKNDAEILEKGMAVFEMLYASKK